MFKSIKSEQKKIYSQSLFETDNSSNSSKTKKIKFCTYSPLAPTFLLKKKFDVIKSKKHKNKDTLNEYISHGYWDRNEHNKFIDALYLYNCKWLKIEAYIKNRSYKQIRSHAQKFYSKFKKDIVENYNKDFMNLFENKPSNNKLNEILDEENKKEYQFENKLTEQQKEKLSALISKFLNDENSLNNKNEKEIKTKIFTFVKEKKRKFSNDQNLTENPFNIIFPTEETNENNEKSNDSS